MTYEERAKIVDVLCSQALADHLGDVRDAEVVLWELIGVSKNTIVLESDSAFQNTAQTLKNHGILLPDYLRDESDKSY